MNAPVITVAQQQELLQNGDLVVLTAGVPLGISGTTNLMKVHLVGNILVSGQTIVNDLSAHGHLMVCKSEEEALANGNRVACLQRTVVCECRGLGMGS